MGIEAIGSNQSYQPTPIDSSSVSKTGADTVTVDAIKPVGQVAEGNIKAENGDQPSDEEIKSAIKEANKRAIFGHASAEFSYHEATKRISLKIVDNDTKEIITAELTGGMIACIVVGTDRLSIVLAYSSFILE